MLHRRSVAGVVTALAVGPLATQHQALFLIFAGTFQPCLPFCQQSDAPDISCDLFVACRYGKSFSEKKVLKYYLEFLTLSLFIIKIQLANSRFPLKVK